MRKLIPPSTTLRATRLKMGYSVEDFAELLGLKKPTYQGYESGRRPAPEDVVPKALDALKRDREFFKGLPKRVDAELKGRAVPNEARPGEW